MPIHIPIHVNEKQITQIHIARVNGGMDREAGKEHGYVVLEQPNPPATDKEWDEGIPFTHTYGDGLLVCVEKALHALNNSQK